MAKGHPVAGAELSEIAVRQLFDDLGVAPDVTAEGALTRYAAKGLVVFAGDIFDLDRQTLGPVDAVYDRAALVALPQDMRGRYAAHVTDLAGRAPQLLLSFAYDQSVMPGPPFSVPDAEVRKLYGGAYDLTVLATAPVPGGLKGICPADETVWLMRGHAPG
jgi:thiopurine S-methyltransferase